MDITAISDLHGHYPELEGGDLLIVGGDLTSQDTQKQHLRFLHWLGEQDYKRKIWIAGNHDNYLLNTKFISLQDLGMEYLCDSGTEFEGLKIWGSPWTLKFYGMNPKCMAYTCETEEDLNQKWKKIPDDIDILITHSPFYGVLDEVKMKQRHAGSSSLREHVLGRIKPKLHIVGHIHDGHGMAVIDSSKIVNASLVNEYYEPENEPIRIIL